MSDERDTRKKNAQAIDLSKNKEFAVTAARKIAENPSLLEGLGRVVAEIAQHDDAAAILNKVFEKGAAKRYPQAYRAFVKARF